MPTYIGTPVRMKELLHGTGFYITEVLVTSRYPNKFNGRLKFMNGTPESLEDHSWSATLVGTNTWSVLGDGAKMKDGTRLRSPSTFPFSINQTLNTAIRDFVGKWVMKNKETIVERKGAEPVLVAAPKAPAPRAPLPPLPAPAPRPAPVAPMPAPAAASGSVAASLNGIQFVVVNLAEVIPLEGQPREEFTKADLDEIRESLKQEDQQQLITVTPITGVPGKRWELVDGERRYRGCLAAGITTLIAMVKRYKNKEDQFWASFTMNLGRKGHTPLEISRAVARAIAGGKTIQEICVATGFSDCTIYQAIQLQRLDQSLQDLMRLSTSRADRITAGIGKVLSRVPDKAEQIRIWSIARKEKTNGLRKLKVDELVAPIFASLPVKGRIRKPSDNAERLLRILQRAETDLEFVAKVNKADLQALTGYTGTANNGGDIVRRIKAAAGRWDTFKEKVEKVA